MAERERVHLGYGKAPKAPVDKDGKPVLDAQGKPVPAPPHKKVGPAYSGRCVEFRMLTHGEVTHIKDQMGHEITAEMRVLTFNEMVADMAIESMIHSYTEPVTPEKLPSAKWTTTSAPQMHDTKAQIFTPKDLDILRTIYLQRHHVAPSELEDIMGGIVGSVD